MKTFIANQAEKVSFVTAGCILPEAAGTVAKTARQPAQAGRKNSVEATLVVAARTFPD